VKQQPTGTTCRARMTGNGGDATSESRNLGNVIQLAVLDRGQQWPYRAGLRGTFGR
jgi:hypothetical protein